MKKVIDFYNALIAVLFPVEQIGYYTSKWSFWNQMLILQVANIVFIVFETCLLMFFKRGSKAISQIQANNFFLRILKKFGYLLIRLKTPKPLAKFGGWGKIGFFGLAMFGLTPDFQKFGVISVFFRTNRGELPWWRALLRNIRGLVPVFCGGAVRIVVYPLMGKRIWMLVLAMIVVRLGIFLIKTIRRKRGESQPKF